MERSQESSRKEKKNSDKKPKIPQRGVGVAELERIRIQEQISAAYSSFIPPPPSSSSPPSPHSYGFYPFGCSYTQLSPATSWSFGGKILETQQFGQSSMAAGHFLNRHFVEDAQSKKDVNNHLCQCQCHCNLRRSESSEGKEVDLELKL